MSEITATEPDETQADEVKDDAGVETGDTDGPKDAS